MAGPRRNLLLALAGTALAAALAASVPHAPRQHGGEPASDADPKRFFLDTCSACHVAPDLAYATDRAWVEQVRGTA